MDIVISLKWTLAIIATLILLGYWYWINKSCKGNDIATIFYFVISIAGYLAFWVLWLTFF